MYDIFKVSLEVDNQVAVSQKNVTTVTALGKFESRL